MDQKPIGVDTDRIKTLLRRLRRLLPFAAVALGLTGSFFLPNAVAGVMDGRRLDSLVTVGAPSMSFVTAPKLNLPRRIALSASTNTEILALTSGQVMEKAMAEKTALRELAKLFGAGLFEFLYNDCTVEESAALFVIASDDPTVNMITWDFKIVDKNSNTVAMTIDDETGVILRLIYQKGRGALIPAGGTSENPPTLSDGDTYDIVTQLTGLMADYYGIYVYLGDYYYGSNLAYYRVDVMGSGTFIPVPMYGVVRSTGFTMNERV